MPPRARSSVACQFPAGRLTRQPWMKRVARKAREHRTGSLRTGTDAFGAARQPQQNYYVDQYQQYLAKNPHGYRCHSNTGVKFPETS